MLRQDARKSLHECLLGGPLFCTAAVPDFVVGVWAGWGAWARGSAELADERIRGELLMRLRQDAGLSRAEIARRVSVWDRASVRAWERGTQQPSPAKIPLLASALGVKPVDLFEMTQPSLGVLRRAAGLTLTGLAARTGMSYAKCQRLEKGLLEATDDDERRLAAALRVRLKGVRAAARVTHTAAAMRKPTTRPGP